MVRHSLECNNYFMWNKISVALRTKQILDKLLTYFQSDFLKYIKLMEYHKTKNLFQMRYVGKLLCFEELFTRYFHVIFKIFSLVDLLRILMQEQLKLVLNKFDLRGFLISTDILETRIFILP